MAVRPIPRFATPGPSLVRRAVLAASLGAAIAHASPRTDPTMGRAVFTGATSPHPTSISLNPAAVGLGLNDDYYYFALTGLLDYYAIDRDVLLAQGDNSVTATELGGGGVVSLIRRIGNRYTISLEARMPSQEVFPDGHEALRYFTLGGRQRDFISSIASTIRITNRVYFGATLHHHNTFLRLAYTRDTAAEQGEGPRGITSDCGGGIACGYENPLASETYDVRVNSPYISTANLKVTLGFLVRIYDQIWLGIAYHTPPGFSIQQELEGNVRVDRAPRDGGERLTGDAIVDVHYPASVDAEVKATLPGNLELHVGGRWEDLSRMQSYDVRLIGSTLAPAGVPEWMLRTRGMHDAFALWGGVEQVEVDSSNPFLFGGRVGFETSAVAPDRTTPLTIAPLSLTLDLGAQLRVGSWRAQLSYGLQYFLPVNNTAGEYDPRFHADCIASDFDYSTRACRAVRGGYAIATNAGSYDRMLHTVRLGFIYER